MFKEAKRRIEQNEAMDQLLLMQKKAQQEAIKATIDEQYKKLRDENISGVHGMKQRLKDATALEKKGKFGRNSDESRHQLQQLNYYKGALDNPDVTFLSNVSIIPPTETTAPQIYKPPEDKYTIAKDWGQYDTMIKEEASSAKKNNRKPDYTKIKKPDYKPYKPKQQNYITKFISDNPDINLLNASPDLLNIDDYKLIPGTDKTDDGYSAYKDLWTIRHKFLKPNPQYVEVSNYLKAQNPNNANPDDLIYTTM